MTPKKMIFFGFFSYFLLSPAAPEARDGRYCNAHRPSVCLSVRPSVHLSVTFSFRTVTQKRIAVFFSKLCRYVHQVMGVCCIVFGIDGMLFEFFLILKNIKFKFCFQNFMFSSRFMLFPTSQKNCVKKFRGGGGGVV